MAKRSRGSCAVFTLLLFLISFSTAQAQHYAAPGGQGIAPCNAPYQPCPLALAVQEATKTPGSTVFIQLPDTTTRTASFTGDEAEDLTGEAAIDGDILFDTYLDAAQQGGLSNAVVILEGDVRLDAGVHLSFAGNLMLELTGPKTLTLGRGATTRGPGTLRFSGDGERRVLLDTGNDETPLRADLSSLNVVIDVAGDSSRVTVDAVGAGRGSASLEMGDLSLVNAADVVIQEGVLDLTLEDFAQTAGHFRLSGWTDAGHNPSQQMHVGATLAVEAGRFSAYGAMIAVGGDFVLGTPASVALFDGGNEALTLTVGGDFTVFPDADAASADPADRNRFYLAGGAVAVAGDYTFQGTGDRWGDDAFSEQEQGLLGTVAFIGQQQQTVFHRQDEDAYFNDVVLNGAGGILLKSDVFQNDTGALTLEDGLIDSNEGPWTWTVLNPGFERDLGGRNTSALGEGVVQLGAPDSYLNGPIARRVERGLTSGPFFLGGYLFPVGLEVELCGTNEHVFRPLIVQFPDDLDEPRLTRVAYRRDLTPDQCAWPENGLVVDDLYGDTLTLHVLSDQFWQVAFDQIPSLDPNIRVEADELPNVFDIARIRLIQWDCDCTNPRPAGSYLTDPGDDATVLVGNNFVDGVPNIIQEAVDVEACQIIGIASNVLYNPINVPGCGLRLTRWQLIHNTPDAGEVDVYLDDYRISNDTRFQTATPFLPVTIGTHTIDLVTGTDSVNTIPLLTTEMTFSFSSESYVTIVNGEADSLFLLTIDQIRLSTQTPRQTEFFVVHSAPDAPALTLNLLDVTPAYDVVQVLAQNLPFGEWTDYVSVPPDEYLIEVVNADDDAPVAVYRLDLSERMNQTFILLVSGSLEDGSFNLIGFDNRGDPIPLAISTSVDAAEDLPAVFTLHGNYPNPFNPTTTIAFDLPQAADVTVDVIDVLGRVVFTTPPHRYEAGSHRTMTLEASGLPSGTYLYRVVARLATDTHVRTGRLTIIK